MVEAHESGLCLLLMTHKERAELRQKTGDLAGARSLHQKLFPLCQALFVETNPIPVREAMNRLGWDVGAPRLPMTPLGEGSKKILIDELRAFGLELKN